MGKITGFIEYDRETPEPRPVEERLSDFREVYRPMPEDVSRRQAARCMDCGVPFCMGGCPLGNLCPEWNDLVYRGDWAQALERLFATNNFPEFTGRLCPAPCEESCVLGIHAPPVAIEAIEKSIIETAYEQGLVRPQPPGERTGRRVAVVGSGPAGLAAAQQLNRAGHQVTLIERDARPGGLLRYGIPDFKLEKWVIDRTLDVLRAEGVEMLCGVDPAVGDLDRYDATVICIGAGKPRDLPIPGRELSGVHFALEFLQRQNRLLGTNEDGSPDWGRIDAKDRHVVVIGGGDTGSDCIGTALRQGARSVQSFELMPMPPEARGEDTPWPYWPMKLRTNSSHQEGGDRFWRILTRRFDGYNGRIRRLVTVNVEWAPDPAGGRPQLREIPDTEREWPCDLALLALGFLGPEPDGLIARLGLDVDERSNIRTGADYQTSRPGVFAAGDARRGQSLIVWAIAEGRDAAHAADAWLRGGRSVLPRSGPGVIRPPQR